MTSARDQTYDLVGVEELITHPDNPRQGDVDAIAESGFYGTIVAQRSTGHVLAGNHRLQVAVRQGVDVVPYLAPLKIELAGSSGQKSIAASSESRIPVASKRSMIAVSRRCSKVRPAQLLRSNAGSSA